MIENIDDLCAVGQRIIIKVEKIKKKGSIELPPSVLTKEQDSITEGILFKKGPVAFVDLVTDEKEIPELGDKVFFVKYAGKALDDGDDNYEYRVTNDEDIYAIEKKG